MKKTLLFITLLTQFNNLFGQHYNPTYGSPIVSLTTTDPWLMVMGSDVASFVIYEKGQVIYKKVLNGHLKIFEVKLSKLEIQQTIQSLNITDSLFKLPNEIKASNFTDQPTNELTLNFDSLKEINVYGNLSQEKSEARLKTPKSYLRVFDNIMKYDNKAAKEWLPDTVEVMLTDYSYAPEKSARWPKNWPDLKNRTTVKRSDDQYSIYLEKVYLQELIKLVSSLKEKQAVLINGQKFSISYRLPFPNIR